jgi:hypothetical protein
MTASGIDRLIEEHSLVREPFEDAQVEGFWHKARASFAGAQISGLPVDSAFQLTYTAALQATLAVLAARDLRVRSATNHFTAFFALQQLSPELRNHGIRLDGLRSTRHRSIYEPDRNDQDMAPRLDRAIHTVREAIPALRAAILAVRPGLSATLPAIQ